MPTVSCLLLPFVAYCCLPSPIITYRSPPLSTEAHCYLPLITSTHLYLPLPTATYRYEGTRLDRDASPDVPRLCGVAINAYLTMLLDTGTLHCDPHPGNLLRTTDGRLCVLDWGMTLEVPSDLQYALLEFIAHLNTEDYDAIPQAKHYTATLPLHRRRYITVTLPYRHTAAIRPLRSRSLAVTGLHQPGLLS